MVQKYLMEIGNTAPISMKGKHVERKLNLMILPQKEVEQEEIQQI